MKAYYGFKVKGNAAEFLEQFKDFQWLSGVENTGFLGVEINSTEYVETVINFPRILENYLVIATHAAQVDKSLVNKLLSYQKQEKAPIIYQPLEFSNKYFTNWEDYKVSQETLKKKQIKN